MEKLNEKVNNFANQNDKDYFNLINDHLNKIIKSYDEMQADMDNADIYITQINEFVKDYFFFKSSD